jgi:hypothetical protein
MPWRETKFMPFFCIVDVFFSRLDIFIHFLAFPMFYLHFCDHHFV